MSNPYLSPQRIRTIIRAMGLQPSRRMGQHFLVDGHVLAQIVAAAEIHPDDRVVEVGPGVGVLTWELVASGARVLTIERDRRLAGHLRHAFATSTYEDLDEREQPAAPFAYERMHILRGDALQVGPAQIGAWAGEEPWRVVANIPYAITSPLLRHFLAQAPPPERMVVLVQWEVAQRIVAQPSDLSMLAHAIQWYAEPEILLRVGSDSFFPPPAVDSAILRLWRRREPPVVVDDELALFRVIKAGFSQPRKKVLNALVGGLGAQKERHDRASIAMALANAGISPDRRAETLSIVEWAAVYGALRGAG